jgi:hypothetical protein
MLAYDHKVALPVLIVVLALFGLVARYAVRHSRTPMHIARRHARPAEPAQRGVLIINPNSGGGKAERFNLFEEARRRNIEPLLLGRDDDLCELPGGLSRRCHVIGWPGRRAAGVVASVARSMTSPTSAFRRGRAPLLQPTRARLKERRWRAGCVHRRREHADLASLNERILPITLRSAYTHRSSSRMPTRMPLGT